MAQEIAPASKLPYELLSPDHLYVEYRQVWAVWVMALLSVVMTTLFLLDYIGAVLGLLIIHVLVLVIVFSSFDTTIERLYEGGQVAYIVMRQRMFGNWVLGKPKRYVYPAEGAHFTYEKVNKLWSFALVVSANEVVLFSDGSDPAALGQQLQAGFGLPVHAKGTT
jgi:hypothetical protein